MSQTHDKTDIRTILSAQVKEVFLEKMGPHIPTRKDRSGPWYKDSGERILDLTTYESLITVMTEVMVEEIMINDQTSSPKDILAKAKSQASLIIHEHGKALAEYVNTLSHNIRSDKKYHSVINNTSVPKSFTEKYTRKIFDDTKSDIIEKISEIIRKDFKSGALIIIEGVIKKLQQLSRPAESNSRSSSPGTTASTSSYLDRELSRSPTQHTNTK